MGYGASVDTGEKWSHHTFISLVASLFFCVGGTIPPGPTGGIVGPFVRAAGLAVGFVLLLVLLRTANVSRPQRYLTTICPIFPLLAYCYVSVFWSLEPALTLIRSVETTALVVFSLCWVVIAARHTIKSDEIATIVFIAMVGVVLYGCVLNIFISGTPFRFVVQSEDSERERLIFRYSIPFRAATYLQ